MPQSRWRCLEERREDGRLGGREGGKDREERRVRKGHETSAALVASFCSIDSQAWVH